jgi:lysozyme family protein
MPDPFDTLMPDILAHEGGGAYTNNPADRGGPTIWGITEAQARAAHYTGDMRAMTQAQAVAIYRLFYWQQPGFDAIAALNLPLAGALLDLGVNMGPGAAGKFLQRALNVLSVPGPNLTVDGQCGALTRHALALYLAARPAGVSVLLDTVRAFAAVRYVEIAEGDTSQRVFVYGWLAQRAFG